MSSVPRHIIHGNAARARDRYPVFAKKRGQFTYLSVRLRKLHFWTGLIDEISKLSPIYGISPTAVIGWLAASNSRQCSLISLPLTGWR